MLEILATYPDRGELFREYPSLEEEDLRQALAFAAAPAQSAAGMCDKVGSSNEVQIALEDRHP